MRDDLDFAKPLACDVAIAGAGLGGLVAGAILARRGRRVVVVERAGRVGGRGGATPHRGWWLDGGLRDGADPGDLQVGWRYGRLAEREAGVEVPLRPVEPVIRVHRLPDARGGGEGRVVEGRWGAKGFARMACDAFGCPEAKLPVFAAVLAKLTGAGPEERRAALPLALGAWLEGEVADADVRRALLTMLAVIFAERPERASVGRLMGFFARRDDLPELVIGCADHPQVGGMQGLAQPFADAIAARGGRLLLGLAPRELLFEGARAAGLVAVDEGHLALEVRARAVVLAAPVWQALRLLPPERIDPGLAALARALEDEQAEAIGWQAGLRRLPRLRATGESESHAGWNRVLVGPDARYHGGFHLPSLGSRRQAPEGRHLLHAFIGSWLARDERIPWARSRARLETLLAYLRSFYLDLDACLEWSAVQWVERPALLAWQWSGVPRHGVRAPGCEGVYLAGTTFESEAGPIDIAAHAGLEAARAVQEDAP